LRSFEDDAVVTADFTLMITITIYYPVYVNTFSAIGVVCTDTFIEFICVLSVAGC